MQNAKQFSFRSLRVSVSSVACAISLNTPQWATTKHDKSQRVVVPCSCDSCTNKSRIVVVGAVDVRLGSCYMNLPIFLPLLFLGFVLSCLVVLASLLVLPWYGQSIWLHHVVMRAAFTLFVFASLSLVARRLPCVCVFVSVSRSLWLSIIVSKLQKVNERKTQKRRANVFPSASSSLCDFMFATASSCHSRLHCNNLAFRPHASERCFFVYLSPMESDVTATQKKTVHVDRKRANKLLKSVSTWANEYTIRSRAIKAENVSNERMLQFKFCTAVGMESEQCICELPSNAHATRRIA